MAFDDYVMSQAGQGASQGASLSESEHIPAETWCPECSGPPQNERASVAYCQIHMPPTTGEADRLIEPGAYIFHGEAGGDENRLTCNLLHRRQ